MIKLKVASCQEVSGVSKKTGRDFRFYNLFFFMPDGSVGKISSNKPFKQGDDVTLSVGTNSDGYLALRLAE